MKNTLMRRFALLAILGGILTSAMLVGCGGGDDDTATANATTNKTTDAEPDAK